jgi:hypothetical protein
LSIVSTQPDSLYILKQIRSGGDERKLSKVIDFAWHKNNGVLHRPVELAPFLGTWARRLRTSPLPVARQKKRNLTCVNKPLVAGGIGFTKGFGHPSAILFFTIFAPRSFSTPQLISTVAEHPRTILRDFSFLVKGGRAKRKNMPGQLAYIEAESATNGRVIHID